MMHLRSTWPALFSLVCCFVLYLAYAMNNDISEYVAGLVVAAVATLATLVFSRAGDVHFRPRWADLLQAWHIPWNLLTDTAGLLRSLFVRLFAGRTSDLLAAVPFQVGDRQSVQDAGRRALAAAFTSATPNTIVLGYDQQHRLMIFHQLLPSAISAMTKNLGATP